MPVCCCYIIPSVAGVLLVPDVLTVAGRPAFDGFLGVVGVAMLLLSSLLLLTFLLLLAFLLLMTSLLLLASLPILASLRYCRVVAGLYCTILRHTVHKRLSDYRTMAIGLSFFLLLDYRNSEFRTGGFETIGYIGSRPQSIRLSDIGLTKTIGCHALGTLYTTVYMLKSLAGYNNISKLMGEWRREESQ